MNSNSIHWAERIVFLKTAAEVLVGEEEADALQEAANLKELFAKTFQQDGSEFGLDDLLWRADEPSFVRVKIKKNGSESRKTLSALEHWYMHLADVRNDIIHDGNTEQVEYHQNGSQYNGWTWPVADRVLREAIAVQLGMCGYPAVWRQGLSRASFLAFRRLSS